MNVTTELITHLTGLITGAFTSLGSLIASPLGGLIIFGLAVSYLFYVKRMSGVSNVNVTRTRNSGTKKGSKAWMKEEVNGMSREERMHGVR